MENKLPKAQDINDRDKLSAEELKTFVENTAKKGTPRNGRRIEFHFVRRKRKAR